MTSRVGVAVGQRAATITGRRSKYAPQPPRHLRMSSCPQGGAVEDLEEVGSEAEEEEEDAEEMERLAAALEQRLHERGRSGQRPI